MSVLTYGPVRMQIQKTERLGFAPCYTEDGADYLYTEMDFAVSAVVNSQALASAGPTAIAGAGAFTNSDAPAQAHGDALGISLRNLRALLLAPRQSLTFSIGGNVVLSVSGPDAKNGPQVQRDTYVRQIMGTKTAFVYFHVKCWVQEFVPSGGAAARVVLANRYRITSITDEDWYATRHVSGQMIVDVGRLQALGVDGVLTPDAFRQAAFLQIPQGFKRESIQVTVASDNCVLDYSYIDQETPLCLGLRSLATSIEGACTAGVVSPLLDMNGFDALNAAAAAGIAVAARDAGWDWGARFRRWGGGGAPNEGNRFDAGGIAAHAVALATGHGLPHTSGNGIVRITGQRNASKADLVTLGLNILQDRFADFGGAYFTPNGLPRFGSLFVTQDFVERKVEVRAQFVPTYYSGAAAAIDFRSTVQGLMNLKTDIASGGAAGAANPLRGDGTGLNPPPPNAGGTRGNWLGALVTALLSSPGNLPSLPTDPATNIDLAAFI